MNDDSWSFADKISEKVKQIIEKVPKKLKDWDTEINYGIKSGCNEAFYIDEETKRKLISENSFCSNHIKPLLRGRDIKRFTTHYNGQYLIFIRRNDDVSNLKNLLEYLNGYKERLDPKPVDWKPLRNGEKWKGRKSGPYKWYEIQDNVAYFKDFERIKIVWLVLSDKATFAIRQRRLLYE